MDFSWVELLKPIVWSLFEIRPRCGANFTARVRVTNRRLMRFLTVPNVVLHLLSVDFFWHPADPPLRKRNRELIRHLKRSRRD